MEYSQYSIDQDVFDSNHIKIINTITGRRNSQKNYDKTISVLRVSHRNLDKRSIKIAFSSLIPRNYKVQFILQIVLTKLNLFFFK